MVLKEGVKFVLFLSLTREIVEKDKRRFCGLLVTLCAVLLELLFDISRMVGAFYQTDGRRTGYIKGPCLIYDRNTKKLLPTPHSNLHIHRMSYTAEGPIYLEEAQNFSCENYADRLMSVSSSVILCVTFTFFLYFLYDSVFKAIKRFLCKIFDTLDRKFQLLLKSFFRTTQRFEIKFFWFKLICFCTFVCILSIFIYASI